ncbi:MAG: transporter [Sphingobacteriales bacterium]|nr:transporter [Sphingobacteriales bacterium]
MKQLTKLLFIVILFAACHSAAPDEETATEVEPQTPVTVTTVSNEDLNEFTELNATSSYMDKNVVKASVNGYIRTEATQKGKYVSAGQVLFTLITKEARAIGNSINSLDPSFKFTGITVVKASTSGFISEVNHQKGDYVQEGEQLAVISNTNSFVFLLDVPYELSRTIHNQSTVQLTLPDGEHFAGTISSALPSVDSVSQTERLIIKVKPAHAIPENLIAKVRVLKNSHQHATSLPKEAVLTNETQDEFWIMKLLNDTIAVKVPVKKGMETQGMIEITEPSFSVTDRILLTGNYGLSDTAKVKILHK